MYQWGQNNLLTRGPDRNVILVSTPTFSRVRFSTIPLPTKSVGPFCRNSRWRPWKRKYCYITVYVVCFFEFDQSNDPVLFAWSRRSYSGAEIVSWWRINTQRGHETGNSYYYASVRDRKTISASRYRFSRTPKSMEHRPTSSSAQFCMNSPYLDAWRRRNRK